MGCSPSKETSVSPLPAKVVNGGTGHAPSPVVQVDSRNSYRSSDVTSRGLDPRSSSLLKEDLSSDARLAEVDNHARSVNNNNNESNEGSSRQEPRPATLSKEDLISDAGQFADVDKHARSAPNKLRASVSELVQYLCKKSTDPLYQVRAFFVWATENIKYDADGFLGKSEMSPCDSTSVMTKGLSVCEGYANVMESLCKEAGIEVRKISGFAKGYGHSAKQQLTTADKTNHAWNAVFIKGSWFLLDSTWGAGTVDASKGFQKKFNEYYFLTNPEHFVYSHFPYMNNDMEESKSWQLLADPLPLERFNYLMRLQPGAFNVGVVPISHTQSVVQFSDETELSFKQTKGENDFMTTLYQTTDNKLNKVEFSTYMYITDSQLKLKVKPPEAGEYKLQMFAGKRPVGENQQTSYEYLFEYLLDCDVPDNKRGKRNFPYPDSYKYALIDDCRVLEPLGKQIPPNSDIKMRFQSPYLQQILVEDKMFEKDGEIFEGTVKSKEKNSFINVFGSRSEKWEFNAQYRFCVG